MGDEKKPLRERVEEWLAQQGYPFEMQVAQVFRDASFDVRQADFALSQDGITLRDVDVTATMSSQVFAYKDGKDGTPISLGNGLFKIAPLETLLPSVNCTCCTNPVFR